MPQQSLTPRSSQNHAAWEQALHGGEDSLLERLAAEDEPAAALLELESYINGIYRATQHPLFDKPMPDVRFEVRRVLPFVDSIRERLGWKVRYFDLGLLRMIRKSSALSPVLGAGVSMGAGAPSWPELVRLMLRETLEKGLEVYESIPADDNPSQSPIEFLPDGTVKFGGTGSWRFESRVKDAKRYTPEQERTARRLLAEIEKNGTSTSVESLMQGAQICYDLCGQHLFRILTTILYKQAKEPSGTHKAIAELASAQAVPPRGAGLFPGWDSIITYNIDALMSEALVQQSIPHAAWAMRGDELRGDPDKLARESQWHQPVFHLHGYTPRRLFLITDVRFVFSTSQYLTTYKGPPSAILDRIYRGIVANPVHIALYIGCSFTDESMNELLQTAFTEYPGRYHYALLKWPRDRKGLEPPAVEIADESEKYLAFGVRPVWFDRFDEIPGLIRQLQ